jgi:hypothetical protein
MKLRAPLPKLLLVCFAVYTLASLTHFVHNAEYIAFYPNMPVWITRETVYIAWLAIAAVGAFGLALVRWGAYKSALLVIAAYGTLGLDGLGHYALALCSEHSLAANLTIWFEVLAGSLLAVVAVVYALRSLRAAAMPAG